MHVSVGSGIQQISQHVHGASRESRFPVFKAYMDETGIQRNDPYCAIAGYVGNVDEWAKVERDWKFVLEEFKVPYFRALEFYGDDKNKLYVGWKSGKRSAFINNLFDCLRDPLQENHPSRSVSRSFPVNLWVLRDATLDGQTPDYVIRVPAPS